MKENGKTKSEKVRTSLLFTLSLLLFTSAATAFAAEGIPYRAWNEATRQMEDRECTDYTVVTDSTRTFENGKWYVVRGSVMRDGITVNGSAHLILCDGAQLTVQSGENEAGIRVRAPCIVPRASCGGILLRQGYGGQEGSGRRVCGRCPFAFSDF